MPFPRADQVAVWCDRCTDRNMYAYTRLRGQQVMFKCENGHSKVVDISATSHCANCDKQFVGHNEYLCQVCRGKPE